MFTMRIATDFSECSLRSPRMVTAIGLRILVKKKTTIIGKIDARNSNKYLGNIGGLFGGELTPLPNVLIALENFNTFFFCTSVRLLLLELILFLVNQSAIPEIVSGFPPMLLCSVYTMLTRKRIHRTSKIILYSTMHTRTRRTR